MLKKMKLVAVVLLSIVITMGFAILPGCKTSATTTAAAETAETAATTTTATAETAAAVTETTSAAEPELGKESLTYWIDKAGLKPSGLLTIYSYKDEGVSEWKIAQKFMEAYPNVKVDWVTINWSDMIGKIATEVSTGTAKFDMFWADDPWTAATHAYLEDVSSLIPEELKNDIPAGFAIGTSFGGKWYGLPLQAGVYSITYNKDLLKQAGYDEPPKTWDEFLVAAKKSEVDKNKDGIPEIYGFTSTGGSWSLFTTFLAILRSVGVEFWNNDPNNAQISFNNEQGIRALEIMKLLFRSDFSDPGSAIETSEVPARKAIASGQAVMGYASIGAVDALAAQEFPENVGKFAYSELPKDPKGLPGPFISPMGFVIRKGGNVETALAFDLFYMSPEMQKFHTKEYGFSCTRESITKDEEYNKEFPFVKFAIELAKVEGPSYRAENQAIIWDLFLPFFERYLNSELNEKETLSQMEKAFQKAWIK